MLLNPHRICISRSRNELRQPRQNPTFNLTAVHRPAVFPPLRARKNMQFENPAQAVAIAVRSIFDRWTALTLVVEHQMGGSSIEANAMFNTAVAMATSPAKRHELDEYIDLFYATFDRMNTDIEDGSPEEVAQLILKVRDAAARGDFGPAAEVAQKAGMTAEAFKASVQGRQDSDDENDPDFVPTSDMEIEPPRTRSDPIVDDDGFTQVQPRRRKR